MMDILIDRVMEKTGCTAKCRVRFAEGEGFVAAFHGDGDAFTRAVKERGPEEQGWLSELMDWLASKHEEGG